MDRDTTKILIFAAANSLNTARTIGNNLGGDAIRKAQHTMALNTPIQIFSADDKLINDGDNVENGVTLRTDNNDEIRFINAVIDVVKSSDIKSTPLVNRTGTVKERIQEKDYSIVIKGSLIGDKDKFPHNELRLLNFILSDARSISISSSYTRIFGINKVVFKTANFNQSMLTHFNVMPFTINFDSDTDYNFLMNEN